MRIVAHPNDLRRSPDETDTESARAESIWTVVVNWRQTASTLACLASLERGGATLSTVVVVDNEAEGEVEQALRALHPDVTVLPQPANLGFAAAVNIGVRHALARGATAILLLNNDAELEPGAMDGLTTAMAAEPRVGVLTAKVYLTETPERLWAVGGVYTGGRVIELGAGERDAGRYDDARLDFVYGCAMVVRAETFRDIGGFDERYFLYYEDIDLCLRAQQAGWRVAMAPHARVLHEGSKSTQREPAIKVYHHARSRVLFFSRHLRASPVRFAVSEAAFVARRVGRHLIAGELANAAAYVRGTLDALRSVRPRPHRPAVAATERRVQP